MVVVDWNSTILNCPRWDWQSEDYEQRIHESISAVHKAWTNSSYDGLLCFSQGAALGGLLCLLQHHGKLQFKFDFCILVSGFVPDTHREKYTSVGDERIQVPSLHITGDKDSIIESSRSKDLAKFFLDGEVCQHPGGHYLPYTGIFFLFFLYFCILDFFVLLYFCIIVKILLYSGDTKDAVLRFLESQAQTLSAKEDTEVVKEV